MLEHIGVRELRNNVSSVLRRASGGERIVVTVDGRPVAQVGPLTPASSPTIDDLIATGMVVAPRRREGPPPALEPVDPAVDVRIDRVLDDLRGAD